VAITNLNGRLYGLTSSGRLVYRLPVPVEQPWLDLGPAEGLQTLTALGGRLIAGGRDGRLRDRAVVAPRPRLAAVDIAAVSTGNLDLKEGRW
jgi:hypothetical protein